MPVLIHIAVSLDAEGGSQTHRYLAPLLAYVAMRRYGIACRRDWLVVFGWRPDLLGVAALACYLAAFLGMPGREPLRQW